MGEHAFLCVICSWSDLTTKTRVCAACGSSEQNSEADVVSHLDVVFNEARRLHPSLHIETDVHLHLRFLVCQLDDWHLKEDKSHFKTWTP